MYRDIMHKDMMQKQIIDIIDEIKQGETTYIREMTDNLLYNLFCVYNNDINYDETMEYVSLLYRLIFQTHEHQPEIAYHIISGFMRFGQSVDGQNYKPMLDHYVMEAFDYLIQTNGWSILKQFLTILRYNLEKVENGTVFNYILLHISAQLVKDEEAAGKVEVAVASEAATSRNHISDLCYNLPREKSFTWGWLSYYIARIYGARQNVDTNLNSCDLQSSLTSKKMRNYLMIYRRLLTKLRRYGAHELPTNIREADDERVSVSVSVSEANANVSDANANANASVWVDQELNWDLVLNILNRNEYQWADNLIKMTTTNDKKACELAAACEAAAQSAYETQSEVAKACEAAKACEVAKACEATTACKLAAALEKTVDSTYEVVALETCEVVDAGVVVDADVVVDAGVVVDVPEKKTGNSSWFYSLLGWS